MNEQQFLERAHANPHDDSPEFLAAATENAQRQQLLDDLKRFDGALKAGLASAQPPTSLRQALLDIPAGSVHPDTSVAAANDSFWRRNFRYVAGLVIALGIVGIYNQGEANPLEEMVFSHIYSEMDFLEDDTPVSLDNVNFIMAALVGNEFQSSPDMQNLQINVTKDCYVDFINGLQAVHIVMQGEVGPVTVMVIPNTPVASEFAIADGRFEGVISPTPGGNLVVVGEKSESIQQYSSLLAANINW